MRILFIEPHGDDLLCSASHLLTYGNKIDIITLGHSRSSEKLKEYLPIIIETVTYKDLPEIDYSLYRRTGLTTHNINYRFKLNPRSVYSFYKEKMDFEFLDSEEFSMVRFKLAAVLHNLDYTPYDLVYIPVGLRHPYHYIVNYFGMNYIPKEKLRFYVDKPYYQSRYCQQVKVSFQLVNSLQESTYPIDGNLVEKLLKEVYPTEVGMLRFSSEVLLEMEDIELYEN